MWFHPSSYSHPPKFWWVVLDGLFAIVVPMAAVFGLAGFGILLASL